MTKFDQRMGVCYCPYGRVNAMEEAVLGSIFDEVTDLDQEEIITLMAESKVFKKIAICKTLLYPVEYIINLIFAGKDYSTFVNKQQSLYWKFLTKKITVEEFKSNLLNISGVKNDRQP